MCDENTICIVPIAGVTWTGLNDDIEALDRELDAYNKKTGYDIPIHVDAASGGFILPFLNPEVKWDFRLKWVWSISTSGHKYGLVYPGLGWVVWKDKKYLPEEMSFSVNYLGCQHHAGRAQLLASCGADSGSVLQLHPPGLRRLQGGAAEFDGRSLLLP